MNLSEQEIGMGFITVICKCCGNKYKAHNASNALTYSNIPNYGCGKCKGVMPTEEKGTVCNAQDSNGNVCGKVMTDEERAQDGMCDNCACNVFEEMFHNNDHQWKHLPLDKEELDK